MPNEVKNILERNRNLLGRYINDEILGVLRRILQSDMDTSDKENALFIILKCECYTVEAFMSLLNSIVDGFILNEKVKKKKAYKEILAGLKANCEQDNKIYKVEAITSAMECLVSLDDETYENFAKRLLALPKDYYFNYRFICSVFKDDVMRKHVEKLVLFLDVVLSREIEDTLNGAFSEIFMLEILKDRDLLTWGEEDYKKLLNFCFNNTNWHFVYTLLKMNIPHSRIKLAIDYYNKLDENYITKWCFVPLSTLEQNFENSKLFNFPLIGVLDLDEEEYVQRLNSVTISPYPVSYAKVSSCEHLCEERKTFVLDLINNSDINSKAVLYSDDYKTKDGLDYVAEVATSILASYLSFDDYKKLLSYIVETSKELNEEKKDSLPRTKLELLKSLFAKGSFYVENLNRLSYLIRLIKESDDKYVIGEIIDIAENRSSLGYTDEEFETLVQIIEKIHNDGYGEKQDKIAQDKYFLLKSLFKNENVPYMDRSFLFNLALNSNSERIREITKKLNNEGLINKNIETLQDGLPKDVLPLKENQVSMNFTPNSGETN